MKFCQNVYLHFAYKNLNLLLQNGLADRQVPLQYRTLIHRGTAGDVKKVRGQTKARKQAHE